MPLMAGVLLVFSGVFASAWSVRVISWTKTSMLHIHHVVNFFLVDKT